MQSVLGNTSKVLVEQKSGSLLYLPLDKLIQQSAAAPAVPSPATPDVTGTQPRASSSADTSLTLDPSRSRDALRNREGR
jgi:modulator of FtsH protease HflK